jgi:hypothetical protein
MKKIIVLATLLVAICSATVNAQDAKPKKQVFAWTKQVMTELGISAETQQKVETYKKENDLEQKKLKESEEYINASEEDKRKKWVLYLA